ncbi:hypothetical protein [Streptomyces sp. NPDC057695]|uniref:hypothetical protein n=1 Tax=Streptomyces sp. NPDC057695 TaxID=3346217 RepID=UPI0036B8F4E2
MLAVLGYVGDRRGWWDGLGFTTNIVSSFTGLLFGLPLALVFVAHLTDLQEDAAAVRACQRRAKKLRDKYVSTVISRFSNTSREEMRASLAAILDAADRLDPGQPPMLTPRNMPDLESQIRAAVDAVSEAREAAFHSVAGSVVDQDWLIRIAHDWHRLDDVRLRLHEFDLRWMSDRASAVLSSAAEELKDADRILGPLQPDWPTRQINDLSGATSPREWSAAYQALRAPLVSERKLLGALHDVLVHLPEVERVAES